MRGRATPRKCIDIPIALRTIGYIYRKKSRKTRAKNGFNKILTARFNKALTKKIRIHVCGQACPGERASRRAGRRAHRQAGAGVQAGVCGCTGRCARMCARTSGRACVG